MRKKYAWFISYCFITKCVGGKKDESVEGSRSSVAIVTVRKQMLSADGGLSSSLHFTLVFLLIWCCGGQK